MLETLKTIIHELEQLRDKERPRILAASFDPEDHSEALARYEALDEAIFLVVNHSPISLQKRLLKDKHPTALLLHEDRLLL
jgi:hypothetical protein